MAAGYALRPPPLLEIHDTQAAEKWKKFKLAWTNYSLATELNKKPEAVQVAMLLTVIGEEARDIFSTFTEWRNADDNQKIEPVLAKLIFSVLPASPECTVREVLFQSPDTGTR